MNSISPEALQDLTSEIAAKVIAQYSAMLEVPPLTGDERLLIRAMLNEREQQAELNRLRIKVQTARLALFKKSLPSVLGGLTLIALTSVWGGVSNWWATHVEFHFLK